MQRKGLAVAVQHGWTSRVRAEGAGAACVENAEALLVGDGRALAGAWLGYLALAC